MTHRSSPVRRLVGSTLVGALLVVPLAATTTAPAAAAPPVSTTTVASPSATRIEFGQTVDVELDVDSASGTSPADGTSTLYAREGTSTTWKAVATNTAAALDFLSVRPRMTTTYKVVYGGYDASSSQDDSFASSESSSFTVGVKRTITYPSGGFDMTGQVLPAYGRRTIVVKVSTEETSGFTKYRKIRTDRRGRYAIKLPRRSGEWFWTFIVRGDDQYRGTRFKWRTWAS